MRTYPVHVALLSSTLTLGGCLGALDWLGVESMLTQSEKLDPLANLQDDRLADKHPSYDPAFRFEAIAAGCPVTLNTSGSVVKLDVVPLSGPAARLDGVLYRTRAEALAAVTTDTIPSIEVINGALKSFNDGLYAAVELAVQRGDARLPMGKQAWLVELTAALLAATADASPRAAELLRTAAAHTGAALLIGGAASGLPADLEARARAAVAVFESDGFYARPIGFYTWTPELAAIFAQDRLLQGGQDFGAYAAVAAVLATRPDLRAAYEALLAVPRGLTDPLMSYTPLDLVDRFPDVAALDDAAALEADFEATHPSLFACGAYLALLPASLAPDSTYACSASHGPSSLIDGLIDALTGGEVSFAPRPDSGWYDYQLHALEFLLVPASGVEADHLLLTAAYKKKLVNTFKSLITQTRETHVKQLPGAAKASATLEPVDLYPPLEAEPLPTFYLRLGRAYRFVDTFLGATFGDAFVSGVGRLREDGITSSVSLRDELRAKTELLYGLFVVTSGVLGVDAEAVLMAGETAELDLAACVERARTWLRGWQLDEDVARDPRVMVPMLRLEDDSTVNWAVIGVRAIAVRAEWPERYAPEVVASLGCQVGELVAHDFVYLVEEMVEVRRPPGREPLTRAELRALCDRYRTRDAIVAALEE